MSPAPPDAGNPRHLVWLFAPAAQRQAIAALFAIEEEIGAALRPALDHSVAHARVEWWQHECARLAMGRPTHPLARQLLQHLLANAAGPPDLGGLVESVRLDLASVAFETDAELDEYLHGWAASVFRALVTLGGRGLQDAGSAGRFTLAAGMAIRRIELIATLARDAWHGRIHVPLGIDPGAPERWREQPWPADCVDVLAARLRGTRYMLAEAVSMLEPGQRAAHRPALVWCALSERLARRAVADLPLQHRARRIDAAADTFCAWRAALAADRGRPPPALRFPHAHR